MPERVDLGRVLFTGGSGLLGRTLRTLAPEMTCPSSSEFDVTNPPGMAAFLEGSGHRMIVHAAALTSPPVCDREPVKAIDVNIIGTANVVRLCATRGLRLVYVSTDYVFSGDRGRYVETDPVYPVNRYAWSKLGGALGHVWTAPIWQGHF